MAMELGGLAAIDGMRAWRSIRRWRREIDLDATTDTVALSFSVIRVGPMAFVPIPFETFSQVTMRIGTQSPFPYTLCLSNANGGNGYVPSREQVTLGGYEIRVAKEWRAHPHVNDADQYLVSGLTAMLRALYGKCPCLTTALKAPAGIARRALQHITER